LSSRHPGANKVVLAFGNVKVGCNLQTGMSLDLPARRSKERETAPVQLKDGKLRLRLVVDRPMCEIFYNDGEVYALIPESGGKIGKLTLETTRTVEAFKIYRMHSI
jgi:hypothetical protein